uniref:DNA replication factor RFC1 C-terminal domain-containing protein n=1 Tax=Eucampia antarctica TaxID=49252 RepID=A0A7S2W5M4_9STRA|mmetsp:Transcript_20761/g.19980  ORF Transcript_20761/g.19980 Transcript_20761/m.19980 type:complete len:265 (+) Transcript_20761:3-797(+)
MVSQFQETKRNNDEEAELECLERMHAATLSMSDFAMAENSVRGGNQNWALLPLCSVLAVKTGHHIAGPNGGFLPGFPQFAGWLGKNSSRGRMMRLLKELNHHMNYQVSADTTELRLLYLPVLREYFMNLMLGKDGPKTDEVIQMMDEYGLDRDDLFENLDQFTLQSNPKRFSDLESKVKAAFTRQYNKGSHKSQALVEEQGITKTAKKKSKPVQSGELDVVNDDAEVEDDEEEDDDLDAEALSKIFKPKGRKPKPKTTKGKKKK